MYISIWIIVIGVMIWFIYARNKGKGWQKTPSTNQEKNFVISEEAVFKAQSRFEEKITNETDLPDAISGHEVYIYKKLMRPWFDKLVAQHRYDEKMIQKLRKDWLDYLDAVSDRSTYNYLSLESEDEKESEKHKEDHIAASRKMFAIQDAFAAAIGLDAVSELKKVQKMDFMSFSKQGELAPEGFKWDLGRRELIPTKEKRS